MTEVCWAEIDGELVRLERFVPPPVRRRRTRASGSLFFAPSAGLWMGDIDSRRVTSKRFCDMLRKFSALEKPEGFAAACLKATPEHSRYNRYDRLLVARELGTHTRAEWRALQKKQDHRCHYCGARSLLGLVKDHRTPVSRGGSDAIDNIVASCPPCNWRKGNKTYIEFVRYMRLVP